MKILILLIATLFAYVFAAAQTTDTIIAETVTNSLDISDSAQLPLYVLIVRKKATILDTAYRIDPKVINGIYFLEDRQKSVAKFGDRGKKRRCIYHNQEGISCQVFKDDGYQI